MRCNEFGELKNFGGSKHSSDISKTCTRGEAAVFNSKELNPPSDPDLQQQQQHEDGASSAIPRQR